MADSNEGLDIAIIGMAGKFPGANNKNAFWDLLKNGVEAVTFFSDEELKEAGVDPALINNPSYIKSRAIIEDEDKFDANFFDFFPREVEIMDPQHRLFLDNAWHALEDAGYHADNFDGLIGLFGGVSLNTYLYSFLMSQKGMISSAEGYQLSIGNDKDFLTTRVSYKMNLTGPSLDVQTACSTSLVAIHLACQNLLNFNCDMALAGGVSVTIPQKQGYYYQEGMILSKDGHCRAFDEGASGTISGSGVGLVVLKRLDEAVEDGDHVYAVIKGSAYNNDGANRVGYTAPSVDGQSEVIANAQAIAGVDADSISYIEAHGTGTVLGDPIEISALSQVFNEQTKRRQYCAIGSVKTNIGHLDAAAGVAGLIKTALALENKQIPASLNYSKPNPKIDFENSPFFVNAEHKEWQTENGNPRRAGISSFGIGGTNVHAILEEAPIAEPSDPAREHKLILLSAKTQNALDIASTNLLQYLENNSQANIADIAFTLQLGRKPFNHRRILVCNSTEDAITVLGVKDPKRLLSAKHEKDPINPAVAFMFSGQGAQYVNMGEELYDSEAVFREEVDRCCTILEKHLNLDLKILLYPTEQQMEDAKKELNQTYLTQPALFVIEYALAKLWMHWGIQPTAMVGHSIGEYVAACLSDVMTLEDALKLVAARGKMMQNMPAGAMISVQLDEAGVQIYLNEHVSVGAINSDGVTVLSGTFEAIEIIEKQMAKANIEFRRLHTSHAFHSAMMDPIIDTFAGLVKQIVLNEPQLPYLSNLSGTWITKEQATDPDYYAQHLRNAVRFMDNAAHLLEDERMILLEVGPGTSLATLARKHPNNVLGRLIASSLPHPHDTSGDGNFILNSIGRMWLKGVQFNWFNYYDGERRQRIPLPGYPFERKRFWMHKNAGMALGGASDETAFEGKHSDLSKWFYLPAWKQRNLPFEPITKEIKKKWIVFKDQTGLANRVIEQLKPYTTDLVTVEKGSSFQKNGQRSYLLRVGVEDDYDNLFESLAEEDFIPDHILHFWNVGLRQKEQSFDETIESGFKSILWLSRNLIKHKFTQAMRLDIISKELFQITGFEFTDPAVATLLGPSKVLSQEFPNLSCRNIDITLPHSMDNQLEKLAEKLAAEFIEERAELALAYRGKERWVQEFEALPLEKSVQTAGYLKEEGVYLITGGIGRIGMTLANHLAMTLKAKLALVEFYDFPARDDWDSWIKKNGMDDLTSLRIKRVQNLENAGAEVLVLKADVAELEQLRTAVDQTISHFGQLNGVIHAAGVIGAHAFKSIPELDEEDWMSQFKAKIFGAQNLAETLSDKEVDFVLLQSSMSSILGGLGFGAYAGANAYLDALAFEQNKKTSNQWISVNWDGWNFDSAELSENALGAEIAQLAILPEEGIGAFERIFSYKDITQLIVSTGDLQQRIDKWLKVQNADKSGSKDTQAAGAFHSRPDLPTSLVEPETELDKEVANIWQNLLGIEPIGIHDDFFDLGGNSLMGTQLISQLRETFQVELPLRSLFEDPTIAGVSKIISEGKEEAESGDMGKVSDMLAKMDNLSDEDVQEMLNEKKSKDN